VGPRGEEGVEGGMMGGEDVDIYVGLLLAEKGGRKGGRERMSVYSSYLLSGV